MMKKNWSELSKNKFPLRKNLKMLKLDLHRNLISTLWMLSRLLIRELRVLFPELS